MIKITITNLKTGEFCDAARDVRAGHPDWVHQQLGTESEEELQGFLDQYSAEAVGKGPDVFGVSMEEEV